MLPLTSTSRSCTLPFLNEKSSFFRPPPPPAVPPLPAGRTNFFSCALMSELAMRPMLPSVRKPKPDETQRLVRCKHSLTLRQTTPQWVKNLDPRSRSYDARNGHRLPLQQRQPDSRRCALHGMTTTATTTPWLGCTQSLSHSHANTSTNRKKRAPQKKENTGKRKRAFIQRLLCGWPTERCSWLRWLIGIESLNPPPTRLRPTPTTHSNLARVSNSTTSTTRNVVHRRMFLLRCRCRASLTL